MMKALAAGGLNPAFRPERDVRLNDKWGEKAEPHGYVPNQAYFELDAADYRSPDFPHCHEGKLVKCLFGGIYRIRSCQARLVFMRRPRKDIELSCLAAFGHVPQIVQSAGFDEHIERIIEICRDRRSFVSVHEICYDDVLDEPLTVFRQLQWDGWPIDSYLAANVPHKSEKRYAA